MIMDLVRNFGAWDSSEARDSVFRFRRIAGLGRDCAGGVGCEGCLVRAGVERVFGDGWDVGGVFEVRGGGGVRRRGEAKPSPFRSDFGVSKGFN